MINATLPQVKLWSVTYKKKIIPPDRLENEVQKLKQNNKKIVTLNGSFDLLHAGHLQIIYEASQMGDVLLILLNTDASIQQYKSMQRPIISLENRLQMITALEFVHFATWFDETDPRQILKIIRPHVHVNGAEYTESCIEAETVKLFGGKLHLVARISDLATSDIIKKIQKEV